MPKNSRTSRELSVLTIAGSDSGGGAGIQADLKTFAALGVHGLSAITAVTAQTTATVDAISVMSANLVQKQLDALSKDFAIAAVKIGMLGSRENILAVAHWLRETRQRHVVLDPVLMSSSGTSLLRADAVACLRRELIPLVDVLTPNLPEAEALLKTKLTTPRQRRDAAHDLLQTGASAVLLKGGHGGGEIISDYLTTAGSARIFRHARRPNDARGTGCTLAAAIAAELALGLPLDQAVHKAIRFLDGCLARAYRPGKSAVHVLGHVRKPKM